MADGARTPAPRPDLALAHDCDRCLGWGTVVTPDGHHQLCLTCQHPAQPPPSAKATPQ
ncbi:hypothetical protein ABZ725_29115 [Streptomyces sp. NPDC006872]|uniref:hypothetical protein n=1 Tax=Streptomyces sp. NPDC006872 TaxID=3155720 RepID=UPI0033CA74B0